MLTWIEVRALRNLAPARIELGPSLLVTGANAQGKSSLLEAVYLLATTRSHRTRDPREAIAHGEEGLVVRGRVEEPGEAAYELSFGLGRARGARRLLVGEYEAKLPEYLGLLPALATTGESHRALVGSPAERRRLMDRATAAARPEHLPDLGAYRRALASRNALLKEGSPDAEILPFEVLLARHGEAIAARRAEQVDAWQRHLGAWPALFAEGESATLAYESRSSTGLAEAFEERRPSERRAGMTLIGPHRDDLSLTHEGRDLLRFGSAGQVRSALAALTLAQARRIAEMREAQRPLLLVDDADTDLDRERLEAFLEAAAEEGQVIAASSKADFGAQGVGRRLVVAEGVFESEARGERDDAEDEAAALGADEGSGDVADDVPPSEER